MVVSINFHEMSSWKPSRIRNVYWYEWPKPEWADGYSRRGYYYSPANRERDKQQADTEERHWFTETAAQWHKRQRKHAEFHWKMDNPPRGATVD